MIRWTKGLAAIAALMVCTTFATPAEAAGTPAQKCASAKMRTAGKLWAAKAKCYAEALAESTTVVVECLTKAQSKYDAQFLKIEASGGCAITADSVPIGAKLDANVEDVAGDLGCGNSVVGGDEACDDGNVVNGDGCSATCTAEVCGNGAVEGAEGCDDGNVNNGDGCDNNCTSTACGNGVVTGTEVCDDGNAVNGDGCDENCTASACGNGALAPLEECDDGGVAPADGCSATCTLEASCPCWNTATLDSLFPVGYFDLNGRGGAVCNDGGPVNYAIESSDTCSSGPTLPRSRILSSIFAGGCGYYADLDLLDTGTCTSTSYDAFSPLSSQPPAVACYWNWRKSAVVQAVYSSCL